MRTVQSRLRPFLVFFTLGLGFCVSACDPGDDDDETGDDEPIEILGTYVDDYGGGHTINDTHWISAGASGDATYTILEYDNDEMLIIVQNDATNDYFPELFSRFDWTWEGTDLYYCQSVYDGDTIEDARYGEGNRDDLAAGCGGNPWSMLTPA